MATDKQAQLIASLMDTRDLFANPGWFDQVNAMDHSEYAAHIAACKARYAALPVARASQVIDGLLKLPKVDRPPRRSRFSAPQGANEALSARTPQQAAPAQGLTPGVYRTEGEVYIVKPNKERTRLYAKRLVEIGGTRLTEVGEVVNIEFDYAPGAIYRILPEHRMAADEAKALTLRYGRCIVCGRFLKAAASVERGIGPVCIKYFA